MSHPPAPPATGTTHRARVNTVPLQRDGEILSAEELRQRACTELLRQAAQQAGLLGGDDRPDIDGVVSEAASAAIDRLIEREVAVPEPSEEACLRHFTAHAADYDHGEKLRLRHVLFALTPGMELAPLRDRAETCLLDVRCHDGTGAERFARAARELSNCPSGADGGELGWLTRTQCVPELARELFGQPLVGVLPRLVHSRFGLHVVEVLERVAGRQADFADVRGAVAMALRQRSFVTALRQYLQLLAGQAEFEGVELDSAGSPLLQ